MSILEDLYGQQPAGDPNDLAVKAELARRLQEHLIEAQKLQGPIASNPDVLKQPVGTPSGDAGGQQQAPAPSPQPAPVSQPAPSPAASPQAGTPLPVPNLSNDPMRMLASFLAGAGNRNQGVLGRIGGGMQATQGLGDRDLANNLTYKSLVANGITHADAAAAIAQSVAGDPTMLKAAIGEAFGPKTTPVGPGQVIVGKKGNVVFDNRERQKPFDVAPGHNLIDPTSKQVIATGGLATDDKKEVKAITEKLQTVRAAREALEQAKGYADKAYSGPLGNVKAFLTQHIGDGAPVTSGEDASEATRQLQNIAQGAALQNAKANGGARVTVYLDRAFQALAPNSTMPSETRKQVLDRTINEMKTHEAELRAEMEGAKTGALYKPGQTPGAEPSFGPAVDLGNGVTIKRVR